MKRNQSPNNMTECICPRCGKRHHKLIFWTGRGIPRIYCEDCNKLHSITTISLDEIYDAPKTPVLKELE
jgi:hypothetical protein